MRYTCHESCVVNFLDEAGYVKQAKAQVVGYSAGMIANGIRPVVICVTAASGRGVLLWRGQRSFAAAMGISVMI